MPHFISEGKNEAVGLRFIGSDTHRGDILMRCRARHHFFGAHPQRIQYCCSYPPTRLKDTTQRKGSGNWGAVAIAFLGRMRSAHTYKREL